jgi:hypothetical protein
MVMSAGESGKVSEAKGMMTSAIVGILIVLAAWLLVDTLLKMVLKGGETGQIYGVWQEIQCSTQTEGRSVPDGQVTTGSSGGSVAGVGNEVKFENGKYSLHTTQTDDSLQKNYDKVNTKYASQISTACEGSTIPNCTKVVTALIANESAGDTEITNSEGAQGIMQILEKNGGKTCAPNNTACIQEQISKGVDMLDQSFGNTAVKGSVANMLAAYNGGGSTAPGSSPSGKNPPLATSVNCDGLFAYQCNISPGGLKETQGYVANICKTLIMNGSGC